jgi:hypothetical protein
LEEILTLEELFLLYRACNNEFTKHIKISAMSAGADVSFDEDDWFDPEPPKKQEPIQGNDVRFLPISLGYEG